MKLQSALFSLALLVTSSSLFSSNTYHSNGSQMNPSMDIRFDKDVEAAEIKITFIPAIEMISEGNYSEARTILHDYLIQYPSDYVAIYYAGLNQLQIGNYASALKKLSLAKQNLKGQAQDDAQYYYAVCLMAIADYSSARAAFDILAQDETSAYNKVAGDILSSL